MCFFWKYHFLAQFSYGKHIIFKKGVNRCLCFECWSLHEPCLLHHFASFFLIDQFKSNFKIADQDLFYNTMSVMHNKLFTDHSSKIFQEFRCNFDLERNFSLSGIQWSRVCYGQSSSMFRAWDRTDRDISSNTNWNTMWQCPECK